MAWTKAELEAAIAAYREALVASGRTRGTITTYVGDAERFVRWLSSGGLARSRPREAPLARNPPRRRVPGHEPQGSHDALAAFRELAGRWDGQGRPRQPPIAWPRDRWLQALPDHAAFLRQLPPRLDRDVVRTVGASAAVGPRQAVEAFVATMAWGFGGVGYGPHRTARMLAQVATPGALVTVARAIKAHGAIDAYEHLATDARIRGLGPAFGTKFLAFTQPAGARPMALIHDALVGEWLTAHGLRRPASTTWNLKVYASYLEQMHRWADLLGLDPSDVEYLIFQNEANAQGSQWATDTDWRPAQVGT